MYFGGCHYQAVVDLGGVQILVKEVLFTCVAMFGMRLCTTKRPMTIAMIETEYTILSPRIGVKRITAKIASGKISH